MPIIIDTDPLPARALKDFLPGVTLQLTGCPQFVVTDAVKLAMVEFCRDSCVLRSARIPLATADGLHSEFTLDLPAGYEVHRLHSLWVDGRPTAVSHADDEEAEFGSAASGTISARVVGPDLLRTSPMGVSGLQLDGVLSYVPREDSTTVHGELFRRWHKAIEAKVMADLMAHPGKTWSNAAAVSYYQSLYDRDVMIASTEAGRSTATPLRVKAW